MSVLYQLENTGFGSFCSYESKTPLNVSKTWDIYYVMIRYMFICNTFPNVRDHITLFFHKIQNQNI